MAAKDRLDSIRKTIEVKKRVSVSELSTMCNVTEETIRRDLEKLENEGVLNRTFGGAVLNVANQHEGIHYYKRVNINIEEKRRMAKVFESILKEKTTIMADASTSVMEVVRLIDDSAKKTIITNSTVMLHELANKDINISSTGGTFHKNTLSLQGIIARDTVKKFHVDILLISCKGICKERGIMDSDEIEAEVKRAMVDQAKEVALFVDHTKFDKTALVHMLDWKKINYLITDCKPEESWIEFCQEAGVELIY